MPVFSASTLCFCMQIFLTCYAKGRIEVYFSPLRWFHKIYIETITADDLISYGDCSTKHLCTNGFKIFNFLDCWTIEKNFVI